MALLRRCPWEIQEFWSIFREDLVRRTITEILGHDIPNGWTSRADKRGTSLAVSVRDPNQGRVVDIVSRWSGKQVLDFSLRHPGSEEVELRLRNASGTGMRPQGETHCNEREGCEQKVNGNSSGRHINRPYF
jgi:hypothetical protein